MPDRLASSVVCHICWKDLGKKRSNVFWHAIEHLSDAAKDSINAVEMLQDYADIQQARDVLLIRWFSGIAVSNRRLITFIESVKEEQAEAT